MYRIQKMLDFWYNLCNKLVKTIHLKSCDGIRIPHLFLTSLLQWPQRRDSHFIKNNF